MAAGRAPTGFPLNIERKRDVPANQRGASDCDTIDRMTRAVYGNDVKFHEITGLPLQQGTGCLPPDEQALKIHLPLIAQRDGVAAAHAMHAKLKAATPEELAAAIAAVAERGDKSTH